MRKTWVVAAESSRARIFSANGRTKPMQELEAFAHPRSRAKVLDINSDDAGHVYDRKGHGIHDMESEMDPKKTEADRFAKELADHLDQARAEGRFEALVLIAAPEFLGLLRKHLSPETAKLVTRSVSKNLVRADEAVIRQAALELP